MTKFKVEYDSFGYVTRQGDPEDEWDRDSTAANLFVRGLTISDEYFDVALPLPYDPNMPVYLLWADYDTGDSFGRDGNRFEAVDVFQSLERANKAKRTLEVGDGYSRKYIRDDGNEISYCCPWEGYFENLNDLHVEEVRVIGG